MNRKRRNCFHYLFHFIIFQHAMPSHLALHQLLQCEPSQTAENHIAEGTKIENPGIIREGPSLLISLINFAAEVSPLAAFCIMPKTIYAGFDALSLVLHFLTVYSILKLHLAVILITP